MVRNEFEIIALINCYSTIYCTKYSGEMYPIQTSESGYLYMAVSSGLSSYTQIPRQIKAITAQIIRWKQGSHYDVTHEKLNFNYFLFLLNAIHLQHVHDSLKSAIHYISNFRSTHENMNSNVAETLPGYFHFLFQNLIGKQNVCIWHRNYILILWLNMKWRICKLTANKMLCFGCKWCGKMNDKLVSM